MDRNREPNIHEIVNALTRMEERHRDELKKTHEEYVAKLHKLQESVDRDRDPMPEMAEGESFQIEYSQWVGGVYGDFYVNKYAKAATRTEALSEVRKLLADENVAAIHVRLVQPGRDGVANAETNTVAEWQSKAYMAMREARDVGKKLEEAIQNKDDLEASYDQIVTSLEDTEDAQKIVIDDLTDRIRRVFEQLRRDNNNCSYSDPLALMNLLVGVGMEPTDRWLNRRLTEARSAVRNKRKHREAVEKALCTGVWPLAPLEGASDRRRCACGMVWHMDEVPENHNGLECQPEPNKDPADTDPRICRYACTHEVADHRANGCGHYGCKCKATNVQPTPEDPAVECDCGMTWPDGKMGEGHNDTHCQAPEGLKCRICGHDKDDHAEYGTSTHCAPCLDDEYHDFDSTPAEDDDPCYCGHKRSEHQDESGLGGAQCKRCPGDEERSWRHRFTMKRDGQS